MKKIIEYNQIKGDTYYPSFIIDGFPIITHKEMKKIFSAHQGRRSTHTNNKLRVVINGVRVSIRRPYILMALFPYKEFDYIYNGERLIAHSQGNIYSLPGNKRGVITIDDIIILPYQYE